MKLLFEFLGTFLLVFMVFASAGNPIIIGLTLTFVLLMIGKLSGGFVNPAITAAMYFSGSLAFAEMLWYIVVQMAAGVSALVAYNYIVQ